MYQILQKFDIHWHDGGPSIAMMYHLRRVSDLLCNWTSCLLCYMKDVVLHCSIFFKWNKLVRVRVHQPKPLQPPRPYPRHSLTPNFAVMTQPSSLANPTHCSHQDTTLLIHEPNSLQPPRPNPPHSAFQSTTTTKTHPPHPRTQPIAASKTQPIAASKTKPPSFKNPTCCSHQTQPYSFTNPTHCSQDPILLTHEPKRLQPSRLHPPHSRTRPIAATNPCHSAKHYNHQDTTLLIHESKPLQPPKLNPPHSGTQPIAASKTQPIAATKSQPSSFTNLSHCSHQDPILLIQQPTTSQSRPTLLIHQPKPLQPPRPYPRHSLTPNFAVKTQPSSLANPNHCSHQDPTLLIHQPNALQSHPAPLIHQPNPLQPSRHNPHLTNKITTATKTQPSLFTNPTHCSYQDPTLLIQQLKELQPPRHPSSFTNPTHCSHQHPILLIHELKLLQPPRPNPPHSAIQSTKATKTTPSLTNPTHCSH